MTPEEIKAMNEGVVALRASNEQLLEEIKKNGTASADSTAKMEKIQSHLDTLETKINASETERANAKAMETRINELEAKLSRKGSFRDSDLDPSKSERKVKMDAFMKAVKSGIERHAIQQSGILSEAEFKALTLGDNTQAGYLAPGEYVNEILIDQVQYSPIRDLARLRTTSRPFVQIPKRKTTAAATWTAETGSRDETQLPSFGMETLTAQELYAMAKVSKVELEDSAFDLEAWLRMEFAEQFGVSEGVAFISGSGQGKPEGILTNADVTGPQSIDTGLLQGDDIIELYYFIKEQYLINATWICNRSTLKTIRTLKDGMGNYLWAAGIKSDAKPATILDRPYVTCPDMDSIASNKYPLAFGDFRRGYMILDRLEMEVMSDPFTSKKTGMVEFSARKRVGGQVIIAEAIAKLKIG